MNLIWQAPAETWLWIVANASTGAAYTWIGVRHLMLYGGVEWLYGVFILLCGWGHWVMLVFMGFYPTPQMWTLVVAIDTMTAAVSLATAERATQAGKLR